MSQTDHFTCTEIRAHHCNWIPRYGRAILFFCTPTVSSFASSISCSHKVWIRSLPWLITLNILTYRTCFVIFGHFWTRCAIQVYNSWNRTRNSCVFPSASFLNLNAIVTKAKELFWKNYIYAKTLKQTRKTYLKFAMRSKTIKPITITTIRHCFIF